jgi:hypothetical protein
MQVVPLVGVGPVKFGMSRGQVLELLGQPERTVGGGMAIYYLTSRGVRFSIDPRRGVQVIECWSAQHPRPSPGMVTFAGKTDKGIGMGASREEIVAAYGEPEEVDEERVRVHYEDPERVGSERLREKLRYSQEEESFVIDHTLENLRYSQLGMTFVLTEGHLVKLKVAGPRLSPGV